MPENTDPQNEPDPDVDPQDDPETDPQDDPEGDPPPWQPPTQEEWQKTQRALKRANTQAAKLRAEKKGPATSGSTESGEEGTPPAADPDARVKRLAGIAALTAEGLTREQARSAVRFLDLSSVEVDEEGDADLEDAIGELKDLFPQMFAPSEPERRPSPRPRTAGGRAPAAPGKTADRSASDALLRQAGYR